MLPFLGLKYPGGEERSDEGAAPPSAPDVTGASQAARLAARGARPWSPPGKGPAMGQVERIVVEVDAEVAEAQTASAAAERAWQTQQQLLA